MATPDAASLQTGFHYIQLIRNGGFRPFDYENQRKNREVYGRDTPPDYNLTKVTVPVNIFHSKDDDTAIFENVIQLERNLPNVKSRYVIPVPDFGHTDFIYSRFLRKALNDQLITTINNVNKK